MRTALKGLLGGAIWPVSGRRKGGLLQIVSFSGRAWVGCGVGPGRGVRVCGGEPASIAPSDGHPLAAPGKSPPELVKARNPPKRFRSRKIASAPRQTGQGLLTYCTNLRPALRRFDRRCAPRMRRTSAMRWIPTYVDRRASHLLTYTPIPSCLPQPPHSRPAPPSLLKRPRYLCAIYPKPTASLLPASVPQVTCSVSAMRPGSRLSSFCSILPI